MINSLSAATSVLASIALVTLACSDAAAPSSPAAIALKNKSATPTLTPQQSGTTNRLQAISPVNARVAWASGTGGTYVVTTDGGETWRAGVVPGAEALEFRDVEGVSERVAYLMAAGPGEDSRIYKTEDGGATWALQFQNEDPSAFYDCFAFWDAKSGVTFSDGVNGVFPAIRTTNGRTWQNIGSRLPAAQAGEAAFAASGTCIAAQGGKRAWIATGGAPKARVLATTDGGDSWQAFDTPITQGTPFSGGISIAFRDPHHGILAGGDLVAAPSPPTTSRSRTMAARRGPSRARRRSPAPCTASPTCPGSASAPSSRPGRRAPRGRPMTAPRGPACPASRASGRSASPAGARGGWSGSAGRSPRSASDSYDDKGPRRIRRGPSVVCGWSQDPDAGSGLHDDLPRHERVRRAMIGVGPRPVEEPSHTPCPDRSAPSQIRHHRPLPCAGAGPR